MKPRTLLASRFEILTRIRRGGEGQVYRGLDHVTGQPVAIKILHAEDTKPKRFQREVALLTELEHSGIVRYVAHGSEGQQHYLVMEWVDGLTLSQLLLRGLTLQESVDVTRRIADALAVVHVRGMVHRDIKPSNVMFMGGKLEQVKLLDFGIARVVGQQSFTRTGAVVGTPGYMAPEQARGQWAVDARADVFALGCLLYSCMCGHPPFTGQHKLATLASILFLDPLPVAMRCPEAPPTLVELVARMMAKDPLVRPSSAAVVAAELDALGTLPETPRRAHTAQGPLSGEGEAQGAGGIELTLTTQTVEAAGELQGSEPPVFVLAALEADAAAGTRNSNDTFDSELIERIVRAGEIAAGHEGASSYLMDGLFVAVFATGGDRAERAARCALALRRELPNSPMVMGSGGITQSGSGLDRLVETLVEESFQRIAGRTSDELPAGGIRLEDKVAGELTRNFAVLRSGPADYLVASR